ncbi:MAG TPA: SPOR domain-containing protein [Rhodanobacteraceae bacterium]|nr:SPOR domain-containing protein [Rhodanobacteraceae bacterium]
MDSGLLKRLLGAAVLIALAVIFVPMLLPSSKPVGSNSVDVKIPPPPDSALTTRLLQVGPDGASAGASTAAAVSDPDHVATLDLDKTSAPPVSAPATSIEPTTAPQASATAPAASAGAKPAANPVTAAAAPKASAEPPPVDGGAGAAAVAAYSVNLGIYADHAGANKLVAKARQHGFKAAATPETFQGKSVLRVKVGPFASRAAAEAARLKLQAFEPVASMTIEGVAANQASDAPSSALPATQPGAWAVQLGAFSTEGQANLLRDRLRNQGFDGFVDRMDTAKGKLWRVRAGPFATRVAAEAARDAIAQQLKQKKGVIVTQH